MLLAFLRNAYSRLFPISHFLLLSIPHFLFLIANS